MDEMQQVKKEIRRKNGQVTAIVFLLVFCGLVNGAYWFMDEYAPVLSKDVFGFYQRYVFPIITTPFAFLTEKLSFSLGEILIIIGLAILPVSLVIFILLMLIKRKDNDFKRRLKRFYRLFYAWVLVYVLLTETLNCFVLYHTPTAAELLKYPQDKYTPAQLEQLAEYLVVKTNDASMRVTRDDEGRYVRTTDLDKTAKESMKNLSKKIPQLSGYYTTPKPVKNSFFMSQQYLMGIYFPFTMEANYNSEMYPLNTPDTVCHELAHTKGFIREDEANFIAFLACDASDDDEYRYSGYIRALRYVIDKCEENCSEDTVSHLYSMLSDGVRIDMSANSEYWQQVQESDEGLFDSEKVAEVSDKAMEASLKLNGVEDGKKSYGRMVDLLLDWYYTDE
ncbi:MAG: DUF3810 domain-containing protein [Ruminococcus sp.]|nr:DUF3810 domain-containing protein [Ruminococcus sp.]